ncbi:MAG: hypothetical protein ACOC5T_05190 [Elusimicrobiota bacterium]
MRKNIYLKKRDEKFWERIATLAQNRDTSASRLVNKAIRQYLRREEEKDGEES